MQKAAGLFNEGATVLIMVAVCSEYEHLVCLGALAV